MEDTITMQEGKLQSYALAIEGQGNDLRKGDEARQLQKKIKGMDIEELLDEIIEIEEDPLELNDETRSIYKEADMLLQ
jgi:hypothetical protein